MATNASGSESKSSFRLISYHDYARGLKNKEYFGGVVDVEGINSFRSFVKQCSKQFYLAVYREKFRTGASIPAEIDFMTDFLAEGCAATIDKWLIGDGGLSKEQLVDSLFRMTPEELR